MKDNHNGHHEHHNKPKKEKHHRRRHGGLILVLILIIVILILFLLLFNPFGWGGGSGFFGNKGNESGDNTGSSTSSTVISDTSSEVSDTVIIKITENTITIDGQECADENVLKEMVMAIGTNKKYELDHSAAIKETYDKVKTVLTELQDALNIEVNYNE